MARPNPIRELMAQPLPSITYQRRKHFRITDSYINYTYGLLNRYIFDNKLKRPKITQGRMIKCWGICEWFPIEQQPGTYCAIKLSDKWFCEQWFVNTLAHEMVHQYQWDVYRWEHIDYFGKDIYQKSGGHGPSFYQWRDRFAEYDLNLKVSFGQRRWFKHQDFYKC